MVNVFPKRNQVDVTIVLPVHGKAPFLGETLSSIVRQDSKNLELELIVVLDRPHQETRSHVRQFLDQMSNLIVIESETPGIVPALNLGIERARGRYIARIDCDDRMDSSRIRIQCAALEADEDLDCVGSQVRFISETGEFKGISRYPSKAKDIGNVLPFRNCIAHPSVMFRKKTIVESGEYEGKFQGCEDYELWLRIFNGKNIENINTPLTEYRIWSEQVTQKNKIEIINQVRQLRTELSLSNCDASFLDVQSKRSIRKSNSIELVDKFFELAKNTEVRFKIFLLLKCYLKAFLMNPNQILRFSISFLKPRVFL